MKRSEIEWHGDKAYAVCQECGKLVRINKSIFGSVHFCVDPGEEDGR
jgi:hypothetical protein